MSSIEHMKKENQGQRKLRTLQTFDCHFYVTREPDVIK
jgi:hypothetical protein